MDAILISGGTKNTKKISPTFRTYQTNIYVVYTSTWVFWTRQDKLDIPFHTFRSRLTRWVPLMEQELLILPKHLRSPPVFSGVCVTRSLVFCVCFIDRCLSFCTFSCGHCIVCSSSIYRFWLPPFGILWPLYCLFFFDIQILITSLWYLVAIVLSVLLRYTDSDYPFGIFKLFLDQIRVLCVFPNI
jgi:hypothetical protein